MIVTRKMAIHTPGLTSSLDFHSERIKAVAVSWFGVVMIYLNQYVQPSCYISVYIVFLGMVVVLTEGEAEGRIAKPSSVTSKTRGVRNPGSHLSESSHYNVDNKTDRSVSDKN